MVLPGVRVGGWRTRGESQHEGGAGRGVTSGQTPSAEQDGQLEQEKEGDTGQPQRQRPGRLRFCRGGKDS